MTLELGAEADAPDAPRPTLPPGRHVDLPGRGAVFVRELPGPPDAPVALLLHGAAVTGALNFHTVYEPLAGHVRVVSPDHRGHGQSFRSRRRFRLEDAADDAVALADQLGIDRFVAVGYSLGGTVAQLIWHRHPHRVSGLVLAATWSRFGRTARDRARLRAIGQIGTGSRLLPHRRRLDLFMRAATRYSSIERRPAWMVAEVCSGSVSMMVEAMGAAGRFDSSGWIGAVDVPTGLIVMNHDEVVPPDRQHHLASLLPFATIRYLGLRHDGCVTHTDRFAPALVELVRGVVDRPMISGPRRAQLILLLGALLLALGLGLTLWELAGDGGSGEPVPVTGDTDAP